MDDYRDDLDKELEEDEIETPETEDDLLLGLDDEGNPIDKEEDEKTLLNEFGLREEEEGLSDF